MKKVRFTSSFLCAAVLASGMSGVRMLAQLPANATAVCLGAGGAEGIGIWAGWHSVCCRSRAGRDDCRQLRAGDSADRALHRRPDCADLEGRYETKRNDSDLGAAFVSGCYGSCFRGRGRYVSERGSVCGTGWRRMFAWKRGVPEPDSQSKYEDGELDERGEFEPGSFELPGEVHEPGRL